MGKNLIFPFAVHMRTVMGLACARAGVNDTLKRNGDDKRSSLFLDLADEWVEKSINEYLDGFKNNSTTSFIPSLTGDEEWFFLELYNFIFDLMVHEGNFTSFSITFTGTTREDLGSRVTIKTRVSSEDKEKTFVFNHIRIEALIAVFEILGYIVDISTSHSEVDILVTIPSFYTEERVTAEEKVLELLGMKTNNS